MDYTLRITGLLLLTLAATLPASARILRHGSCVVDTEMIALELPACAQENRNGHDYVAHRYLQLFDFSTPSHLASSSAEGKGWIYFNQQGRIIVENVATMDNGPSEFHHGLVRVVVNGKWGLANTQGTFVVPLQYDGILDYSVDRGWNACTGCRTVTNGEHSSFEGGKWDSLDRHGHVVFRGNKTMPIP